MKKLRNQLIGVDQGTKILFSDFEDGGDMWTGEGPRARSIPVTFSTEFRIVPSVHVSLNMWDLDQTTNHRADISVENISATGFDIIFKTWGDTKIARARAAWLAIGEIAAEDEWEL